MIIKPGRNDLNHIQLQFSFLSIHVNDVDWQEDLPGCILQLIKGKSRKCSEQKSVKDDQEHGETKPGKNL